MLMSGMTASSGGATRHRDCCNEGFGVRNVLRPKKCGKMVQRGLRLAGFRPRQTTEKIVMPNWASLLISALGAIAMLFAKEIVSDLYKVAKRKWRSVLGDILGLSGYGIIMYIGWGLPLSSPVTPAELRGVVLIGFFASLLMLCSVVLHASHIAIQTVRHVTSRG
jgi:hypothetical protein